eukprot:283168_1
MGNKHSKKSNSSQHKQQAEHDTTSISTSEQGELEQELRNKWVIGSKCMIFSRTFKQWIYTTIEKIENKDHQEILTVKNYGDEDFETAVSFNRYSNNIQPIYISNIDNNIVNKWTNLLNSNMISNSLYVTQNLLKNKENNTRIKWNIGNILIIFDYKNEKWVEGEI